MTLKKLVRPEAQDPDYVRMNYYPGWWNGKIDSLEITVMLPRGIWESQVTTPSAKWDIFTLDSSGRPLVKWIFENVENGQPLPVNLRLPRNRFSFDEDYTSGVGLALLIDLVHFGILVWIVSLFLRKRRANDKSGSGGSVQDKQPGPPGY